MLIKRKNKRTRLGLISLAVCIVLAAVWGVLAVRGAALAKPPAKEAVRFAVDVTGDMLLVGTFNPDGTIEEGLAEGRAGRTNVVVNRPSPAIEMDFLAALSCFTAGDIYSLDDGGSLDIFDSNKGGFFRYFFRAYGKDPEAELTHYRIDADAEIVSDNGGSFPKGDSGYTVFLSNIRLSVSSGSRKNGCEGSFRDASATVRLYRIQ